MGLQYDYQLSNIKSIRFSNIQLKSLDTLKKYGVNTNSFIRTAIKEKIQKDWPMIKEKYEKSKIPF